MLHATVVSKNETVAPKKASAKQERDEQRDPSKKLEAKGLNVEVAAVVPVQPAEAVTSSSMMPGATPGGSSQIMQELLTATQAVGVPSASSPPSTPEAGAGAPIQMLSDLRSTSSHLEPFPSPSAKKQEAVNPAHSGTERDAKDKSVTTQGVQAEPLKEVTKSIQLPPSKDARDVTVAMPSKPDETIATVTSGDQPAPDATQVKSKDAVDAATDNISLAQGMPAAATTITASPLPAFVDVPKSSVSPKPGTVDRTATSDTSGSASTSGKGRTGNLAKAEKNGDSGDSAQPVPHAKPASEGFAAKLNGVVEAVKPGSDQQALSGSSAGSSMTSTGGQMQAAPNVSVDAKDSAGSPSNGGTSHLPPPEAKSLNSVSSAQLVQSIHQAEMKVGMHSAEFGNLSISTSLKNQAISAQIATDHTELTRALQIHLPAIQEKLGSAYGVQARVELRDGSSSSNGGTQQQADQDQRSHRGTGVSHGFTGLSAAGVPVAASIVPQGFESTRLDIRV